MSEMMGEVTVSDRFSPSSCESRIDTADYHSKVRGEAGKENNGLFGTDLDRYRTLH